MVQSGHLGHGYYELDQHLGRLSALLREFASIGIS